MDEWLVVEHQLPDKPEIVAMACFLLIEQDLVVGKCLRWFAWLDRHVKEEQSSGIMITEAFIDTMVRQPRFAEALRHVGWLAGNDGKLSIPHFGRHLGAMAKKRKSAAKSKPVDDKQRQFVFTTEVGGAERDVDYRSLVQVLQGTTFDEEEIRELVPQWAANYLRLANRVLDPVKWQTELAEAKRLGWDASKLADSIRYSITIDSKKLRAREDDHDSRRTKRTGRYDRSNGEHQAAGVF